MAVCKVNQDFNCRKKYQTKHGLKTGLNGAKERGEK